MQTASARPKLRECPTVPEEVHTESGASPQAMRTPMRRLSGDVSGKNRHRGRTGRLEKHVPAVFDDHLRRASQQPPADLLGDGAGDGRHGADAGRGTGRDHLAHDGRPWPGQRPGRERAQEFRVLPDVRLEVAPVLQHEFPGRLAQVQRGMHQQVGLLDHDRERASAGPLKPGCGRCGAQTCSSASGARGFMSGCNGPGFRTSTSRDHSRHPTARTMRDAQGSGSDASQGCAVSCASASHTSSI